MLVKIIGRLGCSFGRHRRSRGYAKLNGDFYVSRCSYCSIAMRQTGDNGWEVDTGQSYEKNSGRFLDLD